MKTSLETYNQLLRSFATRAALLLLSAATAKAACQLLRSFATTSPQPFEKAEVAFTLQTLIALAVPALAAIAKRRDAGIHMSE